MEAMRFPNYLDAPQRLLFWTVDQIVPFAFFCGLGILFHRLGTGLVVGIALSYFFTRYRDSRPDGFLVHMAYWYGVLVPKARSVINPFIRRIYPA